MIHQIRRKHAPADLVHLLLTVALLVVAGVAIVQKNTAATALEQATFAIAERDKQLELDREYSMEHQPPFLHYDHGAAFVYLAMSPKLSEVEAIHEYVVDIFRREDPYNPLEWEAHIIDHSLDCSPGLHSELENYLPCTEAISRYGSFSVVVPNLSMPAMTSLCRVLRYYYGWDWPYESPNMPESVKKSVQHPGQADIFCSWAYYHRQELPWWFSLELEWQDWEIDMVEAPGDFQEFYASTLDAEDWGDSPWRRPPGKAPEDLGVR